jgi:hypothetical protein
MDLRRPTPATFTTANRPVRCMNHCFHTRPLHVLRHARGSSVSTGKNSSAAARSSRRPTPLCDASRSSSDINAADRTRNCEFIHPPNSFDPIQNT